jgi:hypothetical protein
VREREREKRERERETHTERDTERQEVERKETWRHRARQALSSGSTERNGGADRGLDIQHTTQKRV